VKPTPGYPTVTDGWKLELLDTLCQDFYFTSRQAREIIESVDYADSRVTAAVRIFTRITNPEDWEERTICILTEAQRHDVQEQLGMVQLFNPKNPTGRYALTLSNQLHYLTATRLLQLYRQQWANGFCNWPLKYCFIECTHQGVEINVSEPHKLTLPTDGDLIITFVDLTPLPPDAVSMHQSTFSALRSLLLHSQVTFRAAAVLQQVYILALGVSLTAGVGCVSSTTSRYLLSMATVLLCFSQVLDIPQARSTLEDYRTAQAVSVLQHFATFGVEGGLQRVRTLAPNDDPKADRPRIKDLTNYLQFMRIVSINFSLSGPQLRRLAMDLPEHEKKTAPNVLRCALPVAHSRGAMDRRRTAPWRHSTHWPASLMHEKKFGHAGQS
jgi:hypothetical protein